MHSLGEGVQKRIGGGNHDPGWAGTRTSAPEGRGPGGSPRGPQPQRAADSEEQHRGQPTATDSLWGWAQWQRASLQFI